MMKTENFSKRKESLIHFCHFHSIDKAFFIGSTMMSVYAVFYYKRRKNHLHQLTAEYNDHVIAVEPLIKAEIDRA